MLVHDDAAYIGTLSNISTGNSYLPTFWPPELQAVTQRLHQQYTNDISLEQWFSVIFTKSSELVAEGGTDIVNEARTFVAIWICETRSTS